MPRSLDVKLKEKTFRLESPTERIPVAQLGLGPDKVEAYFAMTVDSTEALHQDIAGKFTMRNNLVKFPQQLIDEFNGSPNYGFQEAKISSWSVGVVDKDEVLGLADKQNQERAAWCVFLTVRHHEFSAVTFGDILPLSWV